MAIASVGTLGTGIHSTSASSFTFNTATNALAAGDFGLLVVSTDNIQTSTGNSTDHTGVSGSNLVATKLGEYTNGQSAAGAGATVSAWLLEATGAVAIGTTITMNLSGAVVDKAASFWKFTKAAGHSIRVSTAFTPNPIVSAINAANGFGSSAFSGGASASRLYFRALAKEANSTTALTVSSGFTTITPQRSRNNAAAMCVRGEFRINTSTGETSNPTMAVVGDTAGLFFALEEYDARPVISVQPKNAFVIDGNAAAFLSTVAGATSFQWKKYTPGEGGGGPASVLGVTNLPSIGTTNPISNYTLPNYTGGSQQIPDGANACLIGGTFFSYGTGGASVISGSAFSVPTNGGDIRNLDQNNNFMSFYGRAMKVGTPGGSDTISITLTGATYGEGPAVQIVWLQVSDPDDFVRDYKQATGNGAISVVPTTDPADIVVAFYGKDTTGGTPTAPSGTTQIGTTVNAGGDYQMAVQRAAAADPATTTTVTIPSTSYPALAAFAIKSTGSSATWDNVSGGSGGTTDDYTTPTLSTTDDGARYRLEATNAYGTTISNEVTAFVSPDGKLVLKALSTAPAEAPSSVASKNIPAPSGILEGFRELMLVGVGATSGGAPTINTPAGWTTQAEWQSSALSIGGGVFALRLALFERKADGPGATVAMTSTAAGYWGWHRTAWAFDAETFIASVNLDDVASSTSPVLPGMTPSQTNAYLLDWLVLGATAGITEASGMTELSENTDHSIGLYGKQLTDTSPVGTRTYAFSPTADAGFAVIELHSLASEASGGTDDTADGVTLTAAGSLIPGSAEGQRSPIAAGQTLSASASLTAGSASAERSPTADGQALAAAASLVAGAAAGEISATASGQTLSVDASLLAGTSEGISNGSAGGQVLPAAAALEAGSAAGEVNATASGSTLTSAASFIAGGASAAVSGEADEVTLPAAASLVPGAAEGEIHATATGFTLSATAALLPGSGEGARHPVAEGQTLAVSASLIPGVASAGVSPVADGVTFELGASLVAGTVEGVVNGTAPGATFEVGAGLVVGSASGQMNGSAGGVTLTAAGSLIPGDATAGTSGVATGVTVSAAAALVPGPATGVINGTAPGATFELGTGLIDGEASGEVNGAADGVVLLAASSLIPGEASAGSAGVAAGVTLSVAAALLSGSAAGSANGVATGVELVAAATMNAGGATAEVNGMAAGATLAVTASLLAGEAFAGIGGNAAGVVLGLDASIAVGGASAVRSPTASGAVLPTAASMVPGAASASINATASGVTLAADAALDPGVAGGGSDVVAPGTTLGLDATIQSGSAAGERNAAATGAAFEVQAALLPGAPVGQRHGEAFGAFLEAVLSFIPGVGRVLSSKRSARWVEVPFDAYEVETPTGVYEIEASDGPYEAEVPLSTREP